MRKFGLFLCLSLLFAFTGCSDSDDVEEQGGTVLAKPSVAVTTTTSSSFKVAWDAVPNAESYKYRLSQENETGDELVVQPENSTSATALAFGDLDPKTKYILRVKAVAAAGSGLTDSEYSKIFATTLAEEAAELTFEKIAATKSGIIKPGCDAVIYREQPSVEAVFEERCKKVGAKLHKANFDSIRLRSHGLEGQVFDCDGYEALELPLLGDHQLHNAAVVLTAVDALRTRGWKLPEEAVRKGLKDVKWPGRFELLRKDPLFIIDGGHNPQCIQALEQNIRDYLPGRPLTVLTGVMQDKDYHCMYRGVAPYANSFITVTPDNPRSLPAGELAAYIRELGCSATACGTIREGVALALEQAGPDGTVLCYGSLYLIGDVELQLRELRK